MRIESPEVLGDELDASSVVRTRVTSLEARKLFRAVASSDGLDLSPVRDDAS